MARLFGMLETPPLAKLPVLLGNEQPVEATEVKLQVPTATASEASEASQLFEAAAMGDPATVRQLLKAQADVNAKDYGGRRPLHIACGCEKAGAREVVLSLLKARGEPDLVDSVGMTPMDIAVKLQNASVRRVLQEHGVELKSALEHKARESSWLLNSDEFKLRKEIGNTLKSVVHLADWNGTTVVVKCVKLERRKMMKQLRKSNSLCLSLDGDDLETPQDTPMVRATPSEDIQLQEACTQELLHEIQLLSSLRHPDLVLFLGACLNATGPVMFVTEYMPQGDLEHYLFHMRHEKQVAHYVPPLSRTRDWCMAVARALAFLHKFPLIHRDLKPLNLLLTKTLEVKVTDFGTSKLMCNPWEAEDGTVNMQVLKRSSTSMTMGVGTHNYMAPEVVRSKHYDVKVDIYALGLIMFYLGSGKRPFYEFKSPTEILDRFVTGEEPRPDASECTKKLRPLMQQCWAVRAEERPTARELLEGLEGMTTGCEACCTM